MLVEPSTSPPGVVVDHGGRVLGPPGDHYPTAAGEPGALGGLGFQTTASVGRRRWREGPAQWDVGPHNEDPPPAGGWWSATTVVSSTVTPAGAEIRFATGEPAGRQLVVRATVGEGTADLTVSVESPATADPATADPATADPAAAPGSATDVEAVGAAFAAAPGERWMGFGERSDRTVRQAGVVEHYVGEGPYQDYEYPFLGPTVPTWALRQRADATYYPLPWVLSTAGHGVAVGNDALSYARLRPGGRACWSLEVEDVELRLRVFAGPSPLEALGRYSAAVGRQAEPEPWWWGPWWQTGHANHVPIEEERSQLARLRAAGAPVSAAETHCRYLPLGEHRGHESAEAARVAHLHGEGLAVLAYLNPLVGEEFAEAFAAAAADGALLRRADATVYTFDAYAGGREPPTTRETQYDFTAPAAAGHWEAVAAVLVAAGYDGWMEDFGEYTPLDARLGGTGAAAGTAGHNRYPTDYHAAAAAVAGRLEVGTGRRLARFVRSGWTGTAAVSPIVWGGDPTTGWGFDGLASAVTGLLSAGTSGVAMWGSDIGGFLSSVEQLTPELLCRWIEFGALSPVMRTKSSGIGPPDVVRPQIWDDGIIGTWSRWAALHTQLNPYLAAAHARYRATGRPVAAALALVDPHDEAGLDVEDQYLFGPDLLAAPVLADGARTRSVHLPPGGWVDLWRCCRYDAATRALLLGGGAGVLRGPDRVDLPAPLDEIPLLVREGALVAMLSPEVDSLSPYDAPGVVNARQRDDVRHLLAFPATGWDGDVGPGEGATSTVAPGRWELELPGQPGRRWALQADLGLLPGGAPASVEVVGAAPGWTFDPSTGVLTATLRGVGLRVRARPGS